MAHHICRLLNSNPLAPFGSLFEIEIEKDHAGETKEVTEEGEAGHKIITLLKLMRYDLLVGEESTGQCVQLCCPTQPPTATNILCDRVDCV